MPRIVPIPYQKLVRVLESEGFVFVRERGDHMIFSKPGVLRPLFRAPSKHVKEVLADKVKTMATDWPN